MAQISFGWHISTWPDDAISGEELRDQNATNLRALEGSFDTVWVSDHVTPPHPHQDLGWPTFECWTTAVHYAAAFPSYRFGQFVMNNGFRPPALLAKMAATQQVLTGGRVIIGMGAGVSESESRSYGYDFPTNGERIGRLAEAVQIMRAMWTQAPACFQGKYYRIENAYCEPRPDPPPPILIGGGGERLTMPVAARWADWWDPQVRTVALYAHKMDLMHQKCEAIERDPNSLVHSRSCGSVAIAASESQARAIAEASTYYQAMGPQQTTIGTPEMIADHLREYRKVGCDHFMISRFADFPRPDGALQFAAEVVPLLRE